MQVDNHSCMALSTILMTQKLAENIHIFLDTVRVVVGLNSAGIGATKRLYGK